MKINTILGNCDRIHKVIEKIKPINHKRFSCIALYRDMNVKTKKNDDIDSPENTFVLILVINTNAIERNHNP